MTCMSDNPTYVICFIGIFIVKEVAFDGYHVREHQENLCQNLIVKEVGNSRR